MAERLPWSETGWSRIAAAHVEEQLPEALQAPGLSTHPGPVREAMPESLVAALSASPRPELRRSWERLADPKARVVVTGQQPGCAGGVLLVLYKAATAVALARRAERARGSPVVPVFWNATDDVDFDEIARVGWPDAHGNLLFLELPRASRRSQAWVGDLPAEGDAKATRAAVEMLAPSARRQVEALLPENAADHGEWVGLFLHNLLPELAILDARNPALRACAAPLFKRYLEMHEHAARLVEESSRRLEAAGFERVLSAASTRMALFLMHQGQRLKVDGDPAPLLQALDNSPESVAPNVMLRPLVQDLLLPVIATVVGPAEIGYLLQLRAVRAALEVPEPAVVPRLTLTLLEKAGWEAGRKLRIPAAALLADDDRVLRDVARARGSAQLQDVDAAFEALSNALQPLQQDGAYATGVTRALKRTRGVRADLERHVEDVALQKLLAEEPGLAALQTCVRPRGRAQERVLAVLWLLARWGRDTGPRLLELAEAHLDALERRALEHQIVVD
ncbi:MAG: bacillithiol biosynthesis BshC [Candidatus Latescibacterota bacterium]|nr:MAG: bacillithiol biosynthesis BshC [Candidatus Latescibacterota bacterium]